MARNGALRPIDLVWRVGTPQWVAAGAVPGIFGSAPIPGMARGPASPVAPKGPAHGIAVWLFVCWALSMSLALIGAKLGGEVGMAASLVNWVVVVASGVWAGIDSAQLGFRRYRSFVAQHPVMVGLVVVVFWAVAFPWYLADREKLKAGALPTAQSPKPSIQSTVLRVTIFLAAFVAYLVILGLLLRTFVGPQRP